MFTGIIEKTGIIKGISKKMDTHRLTVYIKKELDSVKKGDSIAVNGACLTVVDIARNRLTFDIMEETFRNTSFRYMKNNDVVNIEKALLWQSRLEGHFVLGHVDRVGKLMAIKKYSRPYIDVAVAPDDKIYVVKKGSIAIDGISLTIGEIYANMIRAYLIPYTLLNTNLKYKRRGDAANIEFDILGKYVQQKKKGFI